MAYVTGFVDVIGRNKELGYIPKYQPRTVEEYLNSAMHLLTKDINLIVFIEPDLVDVIKKVRSDFGLLSKTKIIAFDIKESYYFQYFTKLDILWKQGLNPYPNSDISTPLYLITHWTKFHWIQLALEIMKGWDCNTLCWIDFDISHDKPLNIDLKRCLELCPKDQIKAARNRNDYHDDHHLAYKEHHRSIISSIVLGSSNTWLELLKAFQAEVEFSMKYSYPVYEDTILTWLDMQTLVKSHLVSSKTHIHLFNDTLCDLSPNIIIAESKRLRELGYFKQSYDIVSQIHDNWSCGLTSLPLPLLMELLNEIRICGNQEQEIVQRAMIHLKSITQSLEQHTH